MANSNKWSGYFKVVSPAQQTTKMTDSQEMADVGAYNNYTWYQRLIQGSASRMTRYREYDLMDNDVEVARALDTIAEEMTGDGNPNSHNPLDVEILTNEEDPIASQTIVTVRAALRRWSRVHDYENMLFHIARLMVKYGDVFFRKKKFQIQEKWKFIHPKNVIAALVDANDATKVVAWQMKTDITKPRSGGYSMPLGAKQDSQFQTEIVPADEIVRFTLNNDMSDTAPFGESILRAVYRSHKQKELLEDSVLIYRIQRAPERRAFYIDVGKMPPQRVKQYLEQIKNEIRQKKVPSMMGGQENVDSVYNPQSMCLALDTKIPLLDGRTLELNQLIKEHNEGKQNWVYSINPENGEVVPGPISWAGITRKNAETIVLTLDNGDKITCTPDHKFPVQGKGFVQAKDLTNTDSLWPFNTKTKPVNKQTISNAAEYTQVYNPATNGWQFVHRLVANFLKDTDQYHEFIFDPKFKNRNKQTIHHKDFNALNNSPENLVWMNHHDHSKYHLSLSNNQEAIFPQKMFNRFEEIANKDLNIKFIDLLKQLNQDKLFMTEYKQANAPVANKKCKLKTDKFLQKMFLRFIKMFGYENWRDYRNKQLQSNIDVDVDNFLTTTSRTGSKVKLLQMLLLLIKTVSVHNFGLVTHLKNNEKEWKEFTELYNAAFENDFDTRTKLLSVPEASLFDKIAKSFSYDSFKDLVDKASQFNHRVINIEPGVIQDTGTLTVDGNETYNSHHTFALTSCFTKNSEDFFFASRPDGRGSKVETLPGGQGLGELADLEYFQRKVWRGLRVPASYMIEQQEGGQIWNDGKVGVAYIQELRFCIFVMRLQSSLEKVLDTEFKSYLRSAGIQIDEQIYTIRLPEPSNFGKYKQLEVDGQLLSAYGTADGVTYLSKRFIMKRYLQLDDDEIILNERMLREERGMNPNDDNVAVLYAPPPEPGMLGGGFGGGAMGMTSGNTAGGLPGAPGEGLPPGPGGAQGPGAAGAVGGGAAAPGTPV